MTLAAAEDALLQRLSDTFAGRIKSVESMPAQLDVGQLRRVVTVTPAAYVAFLGGRPEPRARGSIVASWGVYVVAANAGGEKARRHGSARTIGAYEMLALAYGALDGLALPGLGTLTAQKVVSLYAEAFVKAGLTAYGIVFDLPMDLAAAAPADLSPFAVFHADWDLPPLGNVAAPLPADTPDAADTVQLEQE